MGDMNAAGTPRRFSAFLNFLLASSSCMRFVESSSSFDAPVSAVRSPLIAERDGAASSSLAASAFYEHEKCE
jgi:hypothetical protein